MSEILNSLNADDRTAFDPSIFGNLTDDEVIIARRAWHAAIYAVALSLAH